MKIDSLSRALGPYAPRAPFHQQGPDLTPMVDIAMVILVFFMAAASIVGPGFFIPAPLAGATGAIPDAEVRLEFVGGSTRVFGLGLEGAPLDALREAAAREARAGGVLVLAPSSRTPFADVVRAHDLCASGGWTRIALDPTRSP